MHCIIPYKYYIRILILLFQQDGIFVFVSYALSSVNSQNNSRTHSDPSESNRVEASSRMSLKVTSSQSDIYLDNDPNG